jgi:hypothetical protein
VLETPILKRILRRCSRGTSRLFRTNVALAWVGKATRFTSRQVVTVNEGDVLIRQGRRLQVGVTGWSDLTGWKQIVITPEHVGTTIAQFLVIEVKQPGKNATEPQARFGRMVSDAGGVFGVAHSPEEAESIIKGVDITAHKE